MVVEQDGPRVVLVARPNGPGKTRISARGLAPEWFDGGDSVNPDQ